MATIKSTLELVYDSRNYRSSIIEIEITNWNERNGRFIAEITDFYFKPYTFINDEGDVVNGVHRLEVRDIDGRPKRYITVAPEQVALLSEMIAPLIPEGTPEPVRREIEKTYGLLNIVKSDFIDGGDRCIYNTDPSDWVIA